MIFALMIATAQAAPPIRQEGSFGIGGGFGARVTGFDAKYWLSDKTAIQGIAGLGYYGSQDALNVDIGVDIDFLFEFPSFMSNGDFEIGWNAGFGAMFNGGRLGANGVFGIEFIFDGVPLDLVVDARPALGFYAVEGASRVWLDPINAGLHVRYYF